LQVSVVVAAVAAWQQLGPHAASGIEEVVKILHHQQEKAGGFSGHLILIWWDFSG